MKDIYQLIEEFESQDKKENLEELKRIEYEILEMAFMVKPNVNIYQNDETGSFKWVVAIDKTDFWLDAFLNKEDAVDFCEEEGYKILKVV